MTPVEKWAEQVRAGEVRAVSRAITAIENHAPESEESVFGRSNSGRPHSNAGTRRRRGDVYPFDGDAGISGRPGASDGGSGVVAGCGWEETRIDRDGRRRSGRN